MVPPAAASRPALGSGMELGRYRLDAPLGTRGVGWAATDLTLGRRVALEIVPAPDAGVRQQLHALAGVRHRNLVTVLDVVAIGGDEVIVMDRFDGETMAAWLARCRPSRHAIVRVVAAAAEGVTAAHAAGVVHGALRPDTIVIGDDGRVVVAGFGVSREGHGELAYMTPEQLGGTPIGPAADQFALCATLWEAFTGAPPFAGATREQRALEIRAGASNARRIPFGLRGPLRRGLAFAAAQRWPSIGDLVTALRRGPNRLALVAVVAVVAVAAIMLGVVVATRAMRVSDRDRVAREMKAYAERACDCASKSDPPACAKQVMDELSKWSVDAAKLTADVTKPTDEDIRTGKQLADCMTSAMAAAPPQGAAGSDTLE